MHFSDLLTYIFSFIVLIGITSVVVVAVSGNEEPPFSLECTQAPITCPTLAPIDCGNE